MGTVERRVSYRRSRVVCIFLLLALVTIVVLGITACGTSADTGSAQDSAQDTTTGQGTTEDGDMSTGGSYTEDEVIVTFKTGVTDEQIAQVLSCMGATLQSELSAPTDSTGAVCLIRLDDTYTVESAVSDLNQNSLVEHAQPNYTYAAS